MMAVSRKIIFSNVVQSKNLFQFQGNHRQRVTVVALAGIQPEVTDGDEYPAIHHRSQHIYS